MSKQLQPIPDTESFLTKAPLYERYSVEGDASLKQAWALHYKEERFDAYCGLCNAHSIFVKNSTHSSPSVFEKWNASRWYWLTAICSRSAVHTMFFVFQTTENTIEKIGQYPSLADVNLHDVKKYAKALDKEYFQEFTKAIGLAAHGVGVGSFVYLRRIFESLIEEAHQVATPEEGWDESVYISSRMAERIQLLSHHLPEFLVETKAIYGILSKGIHELSEQECLAAFPVVKAGIELILEEKLLAIQRKQKIDAARKAIQQLSSQQS